MASARPAERGNADLALKVMPPRVSKDLLARKRLKLDGSLIHDSAMVVVQAPPGFGKTALLAQWRLEHLARGAIVAWLSAQSGDDPQRFVQSLALAVSAGSGQPQFGHTLVEGAATTGVEGVTLWLTEVAQMALETVLIVDGVDRLPHASHALVTYLLHNMPANLKVTIASRGDCDLGIADLVAYGECVVIGAEMLRLRLDETLALLRARIGDRIDDTLGARVHDLAEGWPLGVQIAVSSIARGRDVRSAATELASGAGTLHDQFIGMLLNDLDDADIAFLTRIALTDEVHPDLARAVTEVADAPTRLTRLATETPMFSGAEGHDWLHMHTLARDVLRQRFAALPANERAELHGRASHWLAEHGMFEEAAQQALDAGQREVAYDLAERGLYDGLVTQGHQQAVVDWVMRMPPAEVERRPRLMLAAAWAFALGARQREAEQLVARILERAGADVALRCECALIESGAAAFADAPDRFAALHDPWANEPPLRDPVLLYVHANRRAFRALLDGNPALARYQQAQAPQGEFANTFGHVARWGAYIRGWSYLWEGQVLLAMPVLDAALTAGEVDLGRRHPLVCMLAALLAAACWDSDQSAQATALLANRLDVLERDGLPDALVFGYCTAARAAAADGAEHRAFALLEALQAVANARSLPRVAIASLAEQVRLHARAGRMETCVELTARIDVLATPRTDAPLFNRSVDLLRLSAHADVAIAGENWAGAERIVTQAQALAAAMGLGRDRIELLGKRALAQERGGRPAAALLQEARGLAEAYGLVRLFNDAHPSLGAWVARIGAAEHVRGAEETLDPVAAIAPPPREAPRVQPRVTPSSALTPRERDVLELLARNLSNKEIAAAMQLGEETVKWHLKNLFWKLAAGNRKHLVRRARLLGLLADRSAGPSGAPPP